MKTIHLKCDWYIWFTHIKFKASYSRGIYHSAHEPLSGIFKVYVETLYSYCIIKKTPAIWHNFSCNLIKFRYIWRFQSFKRLWMCWSRIDRGLFNGYFQNVTDISFYWFYSRKLGSCVESTVHVFRTISACISFLCRQDSDLSQHNVCSPIPKFVLRAFFSGIFCCLFWS